MTTTHAAAILSQPLEDFITDAMKADGDAQFAKLVASGKFTREQAAAEAAAWIMVKAKGARMIANMPRKGGKR